ncbi:unnamed protein product, partial [Polarella glacialis]
VQADGFLFGPSSLGFASPGQGNDGSVTARTPWSRWLSLAVATSAGAGLGLIKHLDLQGMQFYSAALAGTTLGAVLSGRLLQCSCTHFRACGRQTLELTAAVFGCEVLQLVFHNKYCNLIFRCNCAWEWSGGWDNCNVHNSSGPKCSWCVARHYLSWTTDCLVLAMMLLAFSEAKARGVHVLLLPIFPVVAFLLVGLVVGACFKVATGYPYFLTGPLHGKDMP